MKIGMTFGTFDILHPGHIFYLKNAKQNCDYLITIIARDQNVKKFKGSLPINNEIVRLNNIKKLKIADKVELGEEDNVLNTIKKHKPNIIFLGYDQNIPKGLNEICKDMNIYIQKIQAYNPRQYKSSKLKKIFLQRKI